MGDFGTGPLGGIVPLSDRGTRDTGTDAGPRKRPRPSKVEPAPGEVVPPGNSEDPEDPPHSVDQLA